MARISRYDTTVRCGQSIPTGECEGRVRVWGWQHPASTTENFASDVNVGKCDTCGFEDWSASEVAEMVEEAKGS